VCTLEFYIFYLCIYARFAFLFLIIYMFVIVCFDILNLLTAFAVVHGVNTETLLCLIVVILTNSICI